MKKLMLHSAIAIALGSTIPAMAFAASASATKAGPATLDVRYLRLSALPAIMASTGAHPGSWKTPSALKGITLSQASASDDPVVAWVPASALADPAARNEAQDIVSTGTPLLVTAGAGEQHWEAKIFGIQAEESTVLYQPLPNGTIHMHLFEPSEANRVVSDVHRLKPTPRLNSLAALSSTRHATSADSSAVNPARSETAPTKIWGASKTDPVTGARISVIATVTRDTTKSQDSKLITVKTEADLIPYQSGLGRYVLFPSRPGSFGIEPRGIVVPEEYRLTTSLLWPWNQGSVGARLLAHTPDSTGSTDVTIAKKHTTKTSWGASISPDVSRGLADGKISSAGKLPASVSFGHEKTDEESVTMTLKDYSVAFAEYASSQASSAAWRFPLSDVIAGNRKYFGSTPRSTLRTPMMRQAGLETASTWRVNGDYEGTVIVEVASNLKNKFFSSFFDDPLELGDCDEKLAMDVTRRSCERKAVYAGLPEALKIDYTTQPQTAFRIDLGTPFLTRTPTVLLQSFAHEDKCLTHGEATTDLITLQTCDRSEGNRAQQWIFDEASRYVNRGSGLCLGTDANTGRVRAVTCTQALTQQWEWRADRIHSKFDGGRSRLRAESFGASTAFRPGLDALLPVNATNALLPPWTNYPLKPKRGDLIPGFNFTAAPLPDSYLAFGEVDSAQRWEAIPLIFGIK